jgi:hypothetical protein
LPDLTVVVHVSFWLVHHTCVSSLQAWTSCHERSIHHTVIAAIAGNVYNSASILIESGDQTARISSEGSSVDLIRDLCLQANQPSNIATSLYD